MNTYNSISIVHGYHPVTPLSLPAKEQRLSYRYAVIFDSYNPKVNYTCFQSVVFLEIVSQLSFSINCDSVRIAIDDNIELGSIDLLSEYLNSISEGDRLPPRNMFFKKQKEIVCIEETEFWAMCGDDPPYSDSFTSSFYTSIDMSGLFDNVCQIACERTNATIKEIVNASPIPPEKGILKRFFKKAKKY